MYDTLSAAKHDVAHGANDRALGEHRQRKRSPNDGTGNTDDSNDAGKC